MKFEKNAHTYLSRTGFRMTGGTPTTSSSVPAPALVGLSLAVLVAAGVFTYLALRG